MAQHYDLQQTGPELQALVNQVYPNRDNIAAESLRAEGAEALLDEEKASRAELAGEVARAEAAESALDNLVRNLPPGSVLAGSINPSALNTQDVDLTEGGKLQFADREYNSLNPDGMGYIILRKDKTFAEQVTQEKTIYEIRYDFDLDGDEVTIPEGCVLKFEGGSLVNGTVVFDNTVIIADKEVFKTDIRGHICNEIIYGSWFDFETNTVSRLTYVLTGLNNQTIIFNRNKQIQLSGLGLSGINLRGSNIKIQGLNIFLNSINPFLIIGKDNADPSINVSIVNCTFTSSDDNSRQIILLTATDNLTVKGCEFYHLGYCIIQRYGCSSNNVLIENNIAKDCTLDFIECNSSTVKSKNWTIRNNIYNGGNGTEYEVEHRFIGITNMDNVLIEGNFAEYSKGDAMIHLEGSEKNVIIRNNVFENALGYYIWIINNEIEDVIIDSNIFRVTDINTCGIGGYPPRDEHPLFICYNGSETRRKVTQVINNTFIGLKHDGDYYGMVQTQCTNFCNNILKNLYSIYGYEDCNIVNNRFVDCKNCVEITLSTQKLTNFRYINNIDTNTEDYSLYIRSNAAVTSYAMQPHIISNVFSGKIQLGQVKDIVFNYNICNGNRPVDINLPGNGPSTIGAVNGNIYNGNVARYNIINAMADGLSDNNQTYDIVSDENNIWFASKNGNYKISSAIPLLDSSPSKNCNGLVYFNTIKNTLAICKNVGNKKYWNVSINGEATSDGNITISQQDGNINAVIPIFVGDDKNTIVNRIFQYRVKNALIRKSSAGVYIYSLVEGYPNNISVVCSATGITISSSLVQSGSNGVFVSADGVNINVPRYGDTTTRGNIQSSEIYSGFKYFDTTIGATVTWNGTNWIEEDGAVAGVKRRGDGTQSDMPVYTDIYEGFVYMVNSGTNHFPVYAHIESNPDAVRWYKADGTEYTPIANS